MINRRRYCLRSGRLAHIHGTGTDLTSCLENEDLEVVSFLEYQQTYAADLIGSDNDLLSEPNQAIISDS